MTKRFKTDRRFDIIYELDCTIDDAILYLQGLQKEGYLKLAVESEFDSKSIYAQRPETDEEEKARLESDERYAEKQEEYQRKQYELLKAKYG